MVRVANTTLFSSVKNSEHAAAEAETLASPGIVVRRMWVSKVAAHRRIFNPFE